MTDLLEIKGYSRARGDAWTAMSGPTHAVRHCVAVILGRGGNDDYWMGILPHDRFEYRRVGAIVVGPDRLAYAEACATIPKPASAVSGLFRLATRGQKNFRCFTWSAKKGEIDDLTVEPLVDSEYGAYAAVTLTVRGVPVRFGLSEGRPSARECISAIRNVAERPLPFAGQESMEPRTDGIYVLAVGLLRRPLSIYRFDSSSLIHFYTAGPKTDLDGIASGQLSPVRETYRRSGASFVTESEDPVSRKSFVITPDDRLLLQHQISQGQDLEFGERTYEMKFVPDAMIDEKWARASASGPWPTPDWLPVLKPNGEIEAADIGFGFARDQLRYRGQLR